MLSPPFDRRALTTTNKQNEAHSRDNALRFKFLFIFGLDRLGLILFIRKHTELSAYPALLVIPAKAGIQAPRYVDFRLRGNDSTDLVVA